MTKKPSNIDTGGRLLEKITEDKKVKTMSRILLKYSTEMKKWNSEFPPNEKLAREKGFIL